MKLRHLVLVVSVLFTCFLIAHPIYLYLYPVQARNVPHLVVTELVYAAFGTVLIVSLYLLDRNQDKRKKLEVAEREQKDLLQAVIDCSPYVVYIKDLKGRYILVNNKVNGLLGLPSEQTEFTEKDSFKDDQDKMIKYKMYDDRVVQTKRMVAFEDVYAHDGQLTYFYQLKYPLFDDSGAVKHICGVSVDITELKEAQLKMMEAKKQAIDSKKKQEEFLAYITHDIRTPMNGLLGLTNLLLETELTNDQKQYVSFIRETSTNLLVLVNDILDFSKIQSGKLQIQSTPFIIRDVMRRSLFPLEKMAKEKNLYLQTVIDDRIPETIVGDPLRLGQILTNLVGNSIKFTSFGGVDINISLLSEQYETLTLNIEVADTGIGIPADKLNTVFNQFEQVGNNSSRFYEGTGLGLAIVKKIVEMHNGSISVSSELGKGSDFNIILPFFKVPGN